MNTNVILNPAKAPKAKAKTRHINSAPRTSDPTAPVTPPASMARATLGLNNMSVDQVISAIRAHLLAMSQHPTLTSPTPTEADLQAALDQLVADKAAADKLKVDAVNATATRDASRAMAQSLMTMRISYVDMAAAGDAHVITSAALNVRGTGTPMGELPHPLSLAVELNGIPGTMRLTWLGVSGARSYLVQWADATTADRVWSNSQAAPTPTLGLAGMTLGKNYAFRVSAIGGSTAQSDWSSEVVRMAA